MYPRLSDLTRDFLGFTLPIPIYSFGAMVALAVLAAAWLVQKELDRMYATRRINGVVINDNTKGKRRAPRETVSPSALVGTLTIIALVTGFAGAKLFHILENLDQFTTAPGRMLFSSGGFTFYGGLIVAGLSLVWYVRSKGLPAAAVADALAPGLMIGYGIGRIGCHLAGDGDWGIVSDLSSKPGWIPTWLWAETYPNNILGMALPEPGVYPTSIYEFLMAMALFGVLWALRKHPFRNGWLFALYLLFAGAERMLIEQIRVNNEFSFMGMQVTQAEMISAVLMLLGIGGLLLTSRKRIDKAIPEPRVMKAQAT